MAQSRNTLRTRMRYTYGMADSSVLVTKGVTLGDCATMGCDIVVDLDIFVWWL